MRRIVSYELVLKDCPEEVKKTISEVLKSKNKLKKTHPSTWKWEYFWCLVIGDKRNIKCALSAIVGRTGYGCPVSKIPDSLLNNIP